MNIAEILQTNYSGGGAIFISLSQLSLCIFLMLCVAGISLYNKLSLEKSLIIGTFRTVIQLILMGYSLKLIFSLNSMLLVFLVFMLMSFFAADIVRGRVKEKSVDYFFPTLITMLLVFFIVTVYVTGIIVQASPWWSPQYFIPIGGMVAGNSMNALALSLERFFSDLRVNKAKYEMCLTLGASPEEASRDIFRTALKAGMIPSINQLMGAGLVSIPGMMTGQILAGADPAAAARYQIVVMLMIVASTGFVSFIALKIVWRRCFTNYGKLIL